MEVWMQSDEQTKRRRLRDHGGGDVNDAATSQGTPDATRSWKRQGADSSLEHPERVQPDQRIDFRLLASKADFRLLVSRISLLLSNPVVVICYVATAN